MPDFITRLTSADERILTKRHTLEGTIGFDIKAARFRSEELPVNNLAELGAALDSCSPHQCVIHGRIVPGTPEIHPRLTHARGEQLATYTDAPHHFLLVDLDFDVAADGWVKELQTRTMPYAIAAALPAELGDADMVWRLTASTGMKSGIRVRLAFWLDRPVTGRECKRWLAERPGLDTSIYGPVQPVYCAAPIFDKGVHNPVTGARSGLLPGFQSAVRVPAIPPEPERKPYAGGDPEASIEALSAALAQIRGIDDTKEWTDMGMALYAATRGSQEGLDLFEQWSATAPKYGNDAYTGADALWDRLDDYPPNATGAGFIFKTAYGAGYDARSHSAEYADPTSDNQGEETMDPAARFISFRDDDNDDDFVEFDIDDLLDGTPAEPLEMLIPNFVTKRRAIPIAGAGGSMKSRLVLQMVTAICYGRHFLDMGAANHPVDVSQIVFITYEDEAEGETKRRLIEMEGTLKLKPDQKRCPIRVLDETERKRYLLNVDIDGKDIRPTKLGLKLLLRLEATKGHKVLVIDNATNAINFAAGAMSSDAAVRALIELLDRWCRMLDMTILLPLHPSRAGDDRGDTGFSGQWENAPRMALGMKEIKEGKQGQEKIPTGEFQLRVTKFTGGPKSRAKLVLAGGVLRPVGATQDSHNLPAKVAKIILEALYGYKRAPLLPDMSSAERAELDKQVIGTPRFRRNGSFGTSHQAITKDHFLLDTLKNEFGVECSVDAFIKAAAQAEEMGLLGYIEYDATKRGLSHQTPAGYCRPFTAMVLDYVDFEEAAQ